MLLFDVSVIGGCDLLASESSNFTPEQLEVLSIIRTSADAMLTIINDILDLSKIEAGRVQMINTTFEVRECMESSLDVVAQKAHSRGLEIQYFADLDVPFVINSDFKRLSQCLFNLLTNSIKFTLRGEISLTVHKESGLPLSDRLQSTSSGELPFVLRFCVTDSGVGIPEELQPLLFQPFSREITEMRRSGSAAGPLGSGLGLLITKHLVEMMGGNIGFKSEYGVGSTFWFTIHCMGSDEGRPCWLQQSVNICASLAKDKTAITARPSCLLIHPFAISRNYFTEVCENWGVEATVVNDVVAARSLLISTPPVEYAAVVLDYRSVSKAEQVDAETNQPIALLSASSSPPADDEVHRLQDISIPPDVYMRYSLDHRLLEELGSSVNQHTEHLHRDSAVPFIGLGPITQMSQLRSRVEREVPNCQIAYISTPVKIAILYKAMRNVMQDWFERVVGSSISATPMPEYRSIPIVERHSSGEGDDEHNAHDIECIMVVEDNPVNRKVLTRMLVRAGYKPDQIMVAENGAIGVDMLHSWLKTHNQSDNQSNNQSSPLTDQPSDQTTSSHGRPGIRVCMLLDL